MSLKPYHLSLFTACLLLTGCAFNLVSVKQVPTTCTAVTGTPENFVLCAEVKAKLGTSFPTHLKAGTRWHQVGETEYGAVFVTPDQIVAVEASHIYEAQLVVSNRVITGFYLPVEKTFAPVTHPISIETKTAN